MHDPIVITSAARTAMGGFQGALSGVPATALGARAIEAALAGSVLGNGALDPASVDEVIMGCVLPAGLGQAPARQAALGAGLPETVSAMTINKVCSSGLKAIMLGYDQIQAGSAERVVAGGMESMSNAPYLLDRARAGYRLGHGRVIDHMFLDGLEDAYEAGRSMGSFAEDTAEAYQFSREDQDSFALESLKRAQTAISSGHFSREIAAIDTAKGGAVATDEQPQKAKPDKIRSLKPAFRPGGTVTAANSSSISDGAAALVLMRLAEAERLGLAPLAIVRGHATHSQKPALFTTAPVGAIRKLLGKIDWPVQSVDLFEINEAFAVVTMVAMRELGLGHDRVNAYGGACALGHPIGASGARLVVTLLAALQAQGLKRGIAALCNGGGEATALAIERL